MHIWPDLLTGTMICKKDDKEFFMMASSIMELPMSYILHSVTDAISFSVDFYTIYAATTLSGE